MVAGVDDATWGGAADGVAGAAATVSAMAASTGRFMACTLYDGRPLRPDRLGSVDRLNPPVGLGAGPDLLPRREAGLARRRCDDRVPEPAQRRFARACQRRLVVHGRRL